MRAIYKDRLYSEQKAGECEEEGGQGGEQRQNGGSSLHIAWTCSSQQKLTTLSSAPETNRRLSLLPARRLIRNVPCDWQLSSLLQLSAVFRPPPSVVIAVAMSDHHDNGHDPPPDALIDHAASLQYWNSISPDVNGMLGGFPQISRIDLRGSANFLAKVRRLVPALSATGPLDLGVDCGAGIGRVTDGFLSQVCERVDVVEPVENFARVIRDGPLRTESGVVGDVYTTGLENWSPAKQYNLIWNQWCVGHLTDAQLVDYLARCKAGLSSSGVIVVKENISTSPEEEDIYDEVDSSVTRTDNKFRSLFQDAGLSLVKTEEQAGFPKSLKLFPVRFYALRPAS